MKFIQKINPKKGALSKQLGIPIEENIPMTLLNKIVKAHSGDVIKNPTSIGNKKIKVTSLLEHRAILARNLKNLPRR